MSATRITMLPILLLALASGRSASDCENELIARSIAPDGRHVATMFNRACGATTGFSTQISVTDSTDDATAAGNAFRADGGHEGSWGGPWAEMRWISADHLLVRHAAGARIFAREAQVGSVRISYQPVTP